MIEKIIKLSLKRLSNLVFLPEAQLKDLIEKHQLKGKKAEAGQWFRYLYHLPNADKASFWRGPFETP